MFTLGVSLILFYGGLNLSLRRPPLASGFGAGMLVIPGVVLTTLITGAVAHLAFGLPWTASLLMGAILSPTDPAISFVRSRLRQKVAQTVVAESAFNDPTGAVLALSFAGVLLSGDASLAKPAVEFVGDLAISTVLGVLAGVLLSRRSRAAGPVSGASPRRRGARRSSPSPASLWTWPAAAAISAPSSPG